MKKALLVLNLFVFTFFYSLNAFYANCVYGHATKYTRSSITQSGDTIHIIRAFSVMPHHCNFAKLIKAAASASIVSIKPFTINY